MRQQAKQASPRRVGFPLPHPDAIEIKTVPEQIIIKVLALYIDEGGCSGRETRPLRCNARVYRQQNICTKPIIEASFACISMKANVRDGRPVPYIAMPVYAGIKHLHKQIIEVSFAYFSFQRKVRCLLFFSKKRRSEGSEKPVCVKGAHSVPVADTVKAVFPR